jgi:hypothetical protein
VAYLSNVQFTFVPEAYLRVSIKFSGLLRLYLTERWLELCM